jgi:hypothetical protein
MAACEVAHGTRLKVFIIMDRVVVFYVYKIMIVLVSEKA